MPVSDTVKLVDESERVLETPPRERLRAVQTPQAFRAEILLDAYRRAGPRADSMTDDCEVVAAAGYPVVLCEGEADNRKITHLEDMVWAEAIAAPRAKPLCAGCSRAFEAQADWSVIADPSGGG
jgi:2-C-methyl-D-erythritol 4-phosphate cytidylyltransferase